MLHISNTNRHIVLFSWCQKVSHKSKKGQHNVIMQTQLLLFQIKVSWIVT